MYTLKQTYPKMEGSPFHLSTNIYEACLCAWCWTKQKNSFISEKPGLQLVKNPPTMQETLV